MTAELESQIEAAFDFRGWVTVVLKNGSSLEGFLFNRQRRSPKLKEPPFVELILKSGGETRKLAVAELSSVALTGNDCAAGRKS